MRRRVFPTLLAGTLLVSGLSGCSLIFGSNVSQSDLEDEVFKELTDQVGEEPDEVRCKGDLEAEEDAEQTCALGADDVWVEIDVRVTNVDGNDVEFEFKAADAPLDGEPDY